MKTILNPLRPLRSILTLGALLACVPLTSAFHSAQAQPPRYAPAYGYRAKRTVRTYPGRTYRPSRTYRQSRTYLGRTYRPSRTYRSYGSTRLYGTPYGTTRRRTTTRDYYTRTYRR